MQKHSLIGRRALLTGGVAAFGATAVGGLGAAQSTAYQETSIPKDASRISGSISFSGTEVVAPRFPVMKDNDICGEGFRSPRSLVVSDEGRLADCVVHIRNVTSGKPWDPIFKSGTIIQTDCSFQPYVQILRTRASVDVHNFDPLLHNIHAYEVFGKTRRSMFNLAQPRAGQVDTLDLNFRRGNVMMIDCNAHNWMSAWVYTSSNPYFAFTSLDGLFEINDVPPGTYELVVWHPMLGERKASLTMAPNADLKFELVLSS